MHLIYPPPPKKKVHNHNAVVSREIEDNGYAKFRGGGVGGGKQGALWPM